MSADPGGMNDALHGRGGCSDQHDNVKLGVVPEHGVAIGEHAVAPRGSVAIGWGALVTEKFGGSVAIGRGAMADEVDQFVVAFGGVQVKIHADGRVELPEGMSADEAARGFWDTLGKLWEKVRPGSCKKCSP